MASRHLVDMVVLLHNLVRDIKTAMMVTAVVIRALRQLAQRVMSHRIQMIIIQVGSPMVSQIDSLTFKKIDAMFTVVQLTVNPFNSSLVSKIYNFLF